MERKTDVRMTALAAAAFCAAVLAALSARPVPGLRAGPLAPPAPPRPTRTDPVASPDEGASEALRDALNAGAPADPLEREIAAAQPLTAAVPRLRARRAAADVSRTGRPRARAPSSAAPAREAATPRPGEVARRSRPSASASAEYANGPSGGRAAARRAATAANAFADAARRPSPLAPRAGHEAAQNAAAALPRLSPFERGRAAAEARSSARAARARHPRESPLFAAARKRAGKKERAASPADARAQRPRRFHPLTLSGLLGRRALTPPPASLQPPAALAALASAAAPIAARPAGLPQVESIDPARLRRDRRAGAHWDGDQWHSGSVRGVSAAGTWTWLYHDAGRWWADAGGTPLLRREGLWWTKQGGVWFVVHDGEPWAVRPFHDWEAEGLFHPATGTEMVYSRDFRKVAVVTPGQGAVVFDAATGAELGAIPEDEMPARRRPRAPDRLPLPRDVFAR